MTNRPTPWTVAVAAVFLLLIALIVAVPLAGALTARPLSPVASPTPALIQPVAVPATQGSTTPAATGATPFGTSAGAVQRDVPYCTAGGVSLLMDIYRPAPGSHSPAPVAVYVHGGGWTSGDKSQAGQQAEDLAKNGYLVAAVNYRLAPAYKWPAQIEDVKCSIRYLRAHASELNIDPRHIGAWGDSAGGHLVALLGLAGPSAGFEGNGGYAGQSSSVQAVVDLYGPSDLVPMAATANRNQIEMFLGKNNTNTAQVLRLASPVTYARKDAPPFLIIHGDRDPLVPLGQSQELYDDLHAIGDNVTFVVVKNGGHGFSSAQKNLSPTYDELRAMVVDFFDRHLK